jgi:hypothetical protein
VLPSLGRYVPLCFVTRLLYCIVLYCIVLCVSLQYAILYIYAIRYTLYAIVLVSFSMIYMTHRNILWFNALLL